MTASPTLPEPIHVPEGSVVITPAQVYSEVINCTRSVQSLVSTTEQGQRDHTKLEARVDGIDKRLSGVERKLWFMAGAAAAFGGAIGGLAGNLFGAN